MVMRISIVNGHRQNKKKSKIKSFCFIFSSQQIDVIFPAQAIFTYSYAFEWRICEGKWVSSNRKVCWEIYAAI